MNLQARLGKLEERFAPEIYGDKWPLEGQLLDILGVVGHRSRCRYSSKYRATARELALLGLLCHYAREHSDGERLVDDAPPVLKWVRERLAGEPGDEEPVTLVEGLSGACRELVELMPAEEQPQREQALYEAWLGRRNTDGKE